MTVGIVGAGLMGRLLAWHMAEAGETVTLFDRDPLERPSSACRVAAAMLAPYSEAVNAERAVFDQGRASLSVWPEWVRALEAGTGRSVFFQQAGSVVVAHPADAGDLQRFRQHVRAAVPEYVDRIRDLDADDLRRHEPALTERFNGGLYLAEEGCLDNVALLEALAERLRERGVVFRQARVAEVAPGRVDSDAGSERFEQVIDVRGFGARHETSGLRGVRGEVLWVQASEVSLSRPVRLMHPRYQLYIAPRPEQRYVIGATEIESECEDPVSVRSSLELLSALYAVHPGFAEASIELAFARCRPAFPDNLPRIQTRPGLLCVNGLYRHGYLLAPRVVAQVRATLDGRADDGPWPSLTRVSEHEKAVSA